MSALLTIQAKPVEGIVRGEVNVVSVTVIGCEALSADTVREIAQEAINAYHGTYNHGRIAALGNHTWRDAKDKDHYTVPVVEYR